MADGVDPRFDPQFQRGFDPKVHKPKRAEERREATRLRSDAEGDASRSLEAPAAEPPVAEPVEAPPVASNADVVSTSSTTESTDLDPPPRRIPYRLVLLLASLASIAGAAALLWSRITEDPLSDYYGNNPGILFRQQFIDSLLIPLLTAGLFGIILWLAVGALRRRDDA